ncbi:MAG: hypothetical protein P8Z42_11070, partial [Anaerolineales bacterium]
ALGNFVGRVSQSLDAVVRFTHVLYFDHGCSLPSVEAEGIRRKSSWSRVEDKRPPGDLTGDQK